MIFEKGQLVYTRGGWLTDSNKQAEGIVLKWGDCLIFVCHHTIFGTQREFVWIDKFGKLLWDVWPERTPQEWKLWKENHFLL